MDLELDLESGSKAADHLVVLVHGLWGKPSHLTYLVNTLRKQYDEEKLDVLVVASNADNHTYDGIDTGGERITHEIEKHIEKLEKDGAKLSKISIVGYSMGGLLARYAIGLLYATGLFERMQPVNFTTFATPHLGARSHSIGTRGALVNSIGPRTLSASGRQLFLVDDFRETGRPLLSVMADADSVFIKGLSSFQHRSLYANIVNDNSVTYYTGAIDTIDPYVDLTRVTLNALPGTEGVILDPKNPVSRKAWVEPTFMERVSSGAMHTMTMVPYVAFFTVLAPLGLTYFLTNAALQSSRSIERVKLHDSGEAGISVERYRKEPFVIRQLRQAADEAIVHAASLGDEEYLPTPPPEEADNSVIPVAQHSESDSDVSATGSVPEFETKSEEKGEEAFPKLALSKEQLDMIKTLNEVGLTKYRVAITAVWHTHAAIIVRIPWRPKMAQGKIVVKHWVDNFVL